MIFDALSIGHDHVVRSILLQVPVSGAPSGSCRGVLLLAIPDPLCYLITLAQVHEMKKSEHAL